MCCYREKQGFEAAGEVAMQVMGVGEDENTRGRYCFPGNSYLWEDHARRPVCLRSIPPLLHEDLS